MTGRRSASASTAAIGLVILTFLSGCGKASSPARTGASPPDDVPVLAAFGLRRDDRRLQRYVEDTADPASARYRDFLTPAELRTRFGATKATVREARAALADAGIDGAELDVTGSVLVAPVTAAQARDVLDVALVEKQGADGSTVVLPEHDPEVPETLRGPITEVVGLTATTRSAASAAVGPAVEAADPGCASAELASTADVEAANRHVGTQSLYDAGHDGTGVTIALWAVGQFDPAPVRAFEQCRDSPVVLPETVDVALTPPAATGTEVTLDVVMAGWTAPGADLVVVRFDPYASLVFPLVQTLATGASRPATIDLLASSITVCEDALPPAERAVAEHLLLGLAATGTTTLVASGDHGTAGCWPGEDEPLAAYPASSPWVTSVGGTAFVRDSSRIVGEEAWSDPGLEVSGGGGASDHLGLPAYQREAGLTGERRRYPDVSSLAAVDRINAIPTCAAGICTWQAIGGTSAVAPTLAGDLAVALSASRAAGGPARLGWLNPQLADWAAEPRGPITDITEGSTDVLGNGCCEATAGWDAATGWGSLRAFDRLAADLVANRPGG